jgi:uncharacterized protein (DUF58 family)
VTGIAFAAILLLLVGVFLDVTVAIILAIFTLLLEIVRATWARYGLQGVTYRRRLDRDRIAWGERIETTIEVWNRKPLPLAWLRADDEASPHVVVAERDLAVAEDRGLVLRNVWTLAPFERVTRRFHIGADRRGVFELGPVSLSVGDLFAREAAADEREHVDRFLVRPRTLPTGSLRRRDTWGGTERAHAGLSEDPSRFAGVRDYVPGDPLRRVHPRASARVGRPVVKVFEPSRAREVLLVVDVQAAEDDGWDAAGSDAVEALFVIVASLARSLAGERAAFGLAAAGYHGAERRFAEVPISEAPGQLERVLDLLARLSSHASAPFDQLLGRVLRTARAGTTIVVVTSRDPGPHVRHLRRLHEAGLRVMVVTVGARAAVHADHARRAGFEARTAQLDGPWATAEHVALSA